jgi:hypothetical protein
MALAVEQDEAPYPEDILIDFPCEWSSVSSRVARAPDRASAAAMGCQARKAVSVERLLLPTPTPIYTHWATQNRHGEEAMTQKPSQIYVVRIWFEPSPEGEVWRASVSQGEERHYFADVI